MGYAPTVTSPTRPTARKTITVYGSTMFNWTQTFCMLIGRYFEMIPILALAGALAKKKAAPMHTGSFPVVGPTFCLLVAAVIVIVGALNFLPGLVMGPVIEHFKMYRIAHPVLMRALDRRPSGSDRSRTIEEFNVHQSTTLIRPRDCRSGDFRELPEAQPRPHVEEPGDVRHRGGGGGHDSRPGLHQASETAFVLQISIWLWFTVLFANFAEAMAEGRGKAQAETLRKSRTKTRAKKRNPDGTFTWRGRRNRCAKATCSSSRPAR